MKGRRKLFNNYSCIVPTMSQEIYRLKDPKSTTNILPRGHTLPLLQQFAC